MNNLPNEIYLMIFKYLPVKDTIILKRVSKKWYQILSTLVQNSLIVSQEINFYDLDDLDDLDVCKASKFQPDVNYLIYTEDDLFSSLKLSSIFKGLKNLFL